MTAGSDNRITPLTRSNAAEVANLHRTGISAGFLSSLGPMFLRQLYKAIPSCPTGFGFICQGDDGSVSGFVACAQSTGKLYKQALARRGVFMAIPLMRFLLRPSVIRRMWQTLRYPSDVGDELPSAEILSIVVAEQARDKGVGAELIAAALDEFKRRGIPKIKVAVWDQNLPANKLYQRCGFNLAVTREHHGLAMNVYVVDLKLNG